MEMFDNIRNTQSKIMFRKGLPKQPTLLPENYNLSKKNSIRNEEIIITAKGGYT